MPVRTHSFFFFAHVLIERSRSQAMTKKDLQALVQDLRDEVSKLTDGAWFAHHNHH